MIFQPFTPCRFYDSRVVAGGPGPFTSGETRTFTVSTGGTTCGALPAAAKAVSANITVVNPAGGGFVVAYPDLTTRPNTATVNFTVPGSQVANAAIVPIGTNGNIALYASQATEIIIDLNGVYLADMTFNSDRLQLSSNIGGWGTLTATNNATVGYTAGVLGILNSNSTLTSAGTIGYNSGTGTGVWGWASSSGRGVFGQSGTGPGVWGESTGGTGEGVHGKSAGGNGVFGETAAGGVAGVLGLNHTATNGSHGVGGFADGAAIVHGVQGQIGTATLAGSAGVHGIGAVTTGKTYAVLGENPSTASESTAILGVSGNPAWTTVNNSAAVGLRGRAAGSIYSVGVFGEGTGSGMQGYLVDGTGALLTRAVVGFTGGDGLWTPNNLTVSGTKSFLEPHPTEAGKVIRYVALEGGEAGTYFRGRGKFSGGMAVIDVPEDFRLVSAEEGLTVQITPIGKLANVAVMDVNLNRITVKSTEDVEFFYTVNGVRNAFPHTQVIENDLAYFVPQGPNDRIDDKAFNPVLRQRLIANGTYNADGSVNMRTAQTKGWDAMWAARDAALKNQQHK